MLAPKIGLKSYQMVCSAEIVGKRKMLGPKIEYKNVNNFRVGLRT